MAGYFPNSTATTALLPIIDLAAKYGVKANSLPSAAANRLAIQQAVTDYATGGANLLLPIGTIYLDQNLSGGAPHCSIRLEGVANVEISGWGPSMTEVVPTGTGNSGDWHCFYVHGTATHDIIFRDMTIRQGAVTNPDAGEQMHLIAVGDGPYNVHCKDVIFKDSIGDGLNWKGEFGTNVRQVSASRCSFLDCGRSGIGMQRFVQSFSITECLFTGGTDQQIDFEPTGYQLVADGSGGSTTVIVRTTVGTLFLSWGIAPGDIIYNQTTRELGKVVSVDSNTQITTTLMGSSWNGASFYFPKHLSDGVIANNTLRRDGVLHSESLLTLTGSCDVAVVNNTLCGGGVEAEHTFNLSFIGNKVTTRLTASAQPAFQAIKTAQGLRIHDNDFWIQRDTITAPRNCIDVIGQGTDYPASVSIKGNRIVAFCRTVAINVESARSVIVADNDITLATPGDTNQSAAINVRATSAVINDAHVVGNRIRKTAASGNWSVGLSFSVNANNIGELIFGGGSIDGCTNPTTFGTGAGAYLSPPLIIPMAVSSGATPLVPVAGLKWFQTSGLGGQAAASAYKPGIFWGEGTPEGVLTAGIGSMALRRDGGAGTSMYIKESGTGNTGWVAK